MIVSPDVRGIINIVLTQSFFLSLSAPFPFFRIFLRLVHMDLKCWRSKYVHSIFYEDFIGNFIINFCPSLNILEPVLKIWWVTFFHTNLQKRKQISKDYDTTKNNSMCISFHRGLKYSAELFLVWSCVRIFNTVSACPSRRWKNRQTDRTDRQATDRETYSWRKGEPLTTRPTIVIVFI